MQQLCVAELIVQLCGTLSLEFGYKFDGVMWNIWNIAGVSNVVVRTHHRPVHYRTCFHISETIKSCTVFWD